jgi:MYXO-CTERM domain-containing protein
MTGRGRLSIAAALVIVAALAIAPGKARGADFECGGLQDTCICGANTPCICCSNATYGTNHGNCVWYGWYRACCDWGEALPFCPNAEFWDSQATTHGYTLLTTPCASTIFVCEINTTHCNSGGYGHVGWVDTVYPNGSIDVHEQGCYSWYGVQTRNFNAAAASPTMHYIYAPGVTSCAQCDCNPGEVQTDICGNCGTDSRTCGGDCHWGGWSGCSGEGVCADGATQGCGICGGTQTCQPDCQWGVCVETCPDASVPQPDGATPQPDGSTPTPDSGTGPLPDGATPQSDASPTTGPTLVRGGCNCRTGGGAPASLALLLALGLLLLRRRWRS